MSAADDFIDDDVFEMQQETSSKKLDVKNDDPGNKNNKVSPTGYRGYQPPDEVIKLCRTNILDDVDVPIHKTILLGDSGVGKTSFLVKFDTGRFEPCKFSATVGIGFTTKLVEADDIKVKLQIWDTAGQERFRCVTHAYYRDAHALLLLYDVTNKKSFDNIRAWLGEIRDYAQDDVVILLIGNKADCNSERAIRREEGERLAREYNVIFIEASAKTGQNVELAFHAIAKELKSRHSIDNKTDQNRFNVQDYVREQCQHSTDTQQCPPCTT